MQGPGLSWILASLKTSNNITTSTAYLTLFFSDFEVECQADPGCRW